MVDILFISLDKAGTLGLSAIQDQPPCGRNYINSSGYLWAIH
jgi:hypothetical protein